VRLRARLQKASLMWEAKGKRRIGRRGKNFLFAGDSAGVVLLGPKLSPVKARS